MWRSTESSTAIQCLQLLGLMCGKYELTTEYEKLPSPLKQDLPKNFAQNYAKQELIKPNDPVLVLKNEGKICTSP